MSEEDFKPIRITLSVEAFERLDKIMKGASFRNYSSTIEECIRVVYEIAEDIWLVLGSKDAPLKEIKDVEVHHAFTTIATRMERLTSRRIKVTK